MHPTHKLDAEVATGQPHFCEHLPNDSFVLAPVLLHFADWKSGNVVSLGRNELEISKLHDAHSEFLVPVSKVLAVGVS